MNFDINDMYQRAPFGLIPPRIIRDIKTRLLLDDIVVREVTHVMLGWNYGDINFFAKTGDRDPLQKMFDTMTRYEPECVITCSDIENHFRLKKCFPIMKVHSVLKRITPVCEYLEKQETINEVIKEIQNRRSNQELYPNAREFKKETNENDRFNDYVLKHSRLQWLKNLTKKKANVLVVNLKSSDCGLISTTESTQSDASEPENTDSKEQFRKKALQNLVSNLVRNFTCLVTPDIVAAEWNPFIDNQFSKASFVVTVFYDECIFNLGLDSLNSGLSGLDNYHKYLWEKVMSSEIPTVAIVFDKSHQIEAENYLIPVFLLPKEMENLLNFIIEF